ncbi:hypothetical protein ACFPTO_18545 [Paraburkholderia denitrificans]|uniref:Uncharacterized protein n=1 Tax=Paraburkholderia denitrificans TaxID=694025 RepID=A0ABW0JCC4_9BURK
MDYLEPSALSISPRDGSVYLRGANELLRRDTPKTFVATRLAPLIHRSINHQNGYEWIWLGHLTFAGLPCGLGLCFYAEELSELSFGVSLPAPELIDGWPNRATSEREIEFVREELKTQMNRSFDSGVEQFGWGSVWCLFDERGQQASSGLRYGDRRS